MMRGLGFDNAIAIDPDMPEWRVWRQYFEAHLGFLPHGMLDVYANRSKAFLVPTQWPSWFDSSFNEDPNWHPVRKQPPAREQFPDFQMLVAQYGRPLGRFEANTKWAHLAGRQMSDTRPAWKVPTDDELRAYYAPKPAQEAAE